MRFLLLIAVASMLTACVSLPKSNSPLPFKGLYNKGTKEHSKQAYAIIGDLHIAVKPTDAQILTSQYGSRVHPVTKKKGSFHHGVDYSGDLNSNIYAAANGKVTFAGWKKGYGHTIDIDHGNNTVTRYAHLKKHKVKKGQKVSLGQKIGLMGNSGLSTAHHLHYELRIEGKTKNIMAYPRTDQPYPTLPAS